MAVPPNRLTRTIVCSLVAILLLSAFVAAPCASASLTDGLVAFLPLKTDLLDHAPAPHTVKVVGNVKIENGAARFPGSQDWLELPYIPLNNRPFAIAVWLRPSATSMTNGFLMQSDKDRTDHILHLMLRDGLKPWFGFYVDDVVAPVGLTNGGWQHVVFQYDGLRQQIWMNGKLVVTRVADQAYQGTSGETCVGRNPNWNNVGDDNYRGEMADFRIYNRTLTAPEIASLGYSQAAPGASGAAVEVTNHPPTAESRGFADNEPLLALDGRKMRLRGKAGARYVLEVSDDLKTWRELKRVSVPSAGIAELVDDEAANKQQRFYRLRAETPPGS